MSNIDVAFKNYVFPVVAIKEKHANIQDIKLNKVEIIIPNLALRKLNDRRATPYIVFSNIKLIAKITFRLLQLIFS